MNISWTMVDISIENDWKNMQNLERSKIRVYLKCKDSKIRKIHSWEMDQTLADVDVPQKISFHISPVPDPHQMQTILMGEDRPGLDGISDD